VRSEKEKWKVPESDPAGTAKKERIAVPEPSGMSGIEDTDRGPLIFCGMCGALNPSTNFYCAACGTTLVDAFHATEGLRVFERPDAASRIIEIVPSGTELDIHDDPDAPDDYVRIRLRTGRLGYIRLNEVSALENAAPNLIDPDTPDPNVRARGCVSSFGALAALALLVVLAGLATYLLRQGDSSQGGFLAFITCIVVAPITLLMVFLYLMARDREDQRLADEEDATKA
jgi:hypothetical protein